MTRAKSEPITANAKFGRLEMGYAAFESDGDGILIAAFTNTPDLHVAFALPIEEAENLAKQILERAKARKEIRDRVHESQEGKAAE